MDLKQARDAGREKEHPMKANIGTVDKVVRILFAVFVGVLVLTGTVGGTAAVALSASAAVMAVTGLVSFCPLYLPLKISTKKG